MKARGPGFQNGPRSDSRSRQRSVNEPRTHESRPSRGADVYAEGVLEMRGPGKVARWEEKFFKLEGCVLDCFRLGGDGQRDSSVKVQIGDVQNLTLEENRHECCFSFNGTKIRLRAKSQADALYWFRNLEAAGHTVNPSGVPSVKKDPENTRATLLTTVQKPWLAKHDTSRSGRRSRESEMSPTRRHRSQDPSQYIPPWSPTNPTKSTPPLPHTLAAMTITPETPRPQEEERRQALQYLGDLNALHGQKLKKLEEQREREVEAERLRIEASKLQERNASTGIRWDPADLNPHEAASRLYEDHRTKKMHMQELEFKLREDEMIKLEQARSPRPRRAHSESALRPDANEAGKRMYEEAMRRVEEKQKKVEDKKTIDGDLCEILASRGVPAGNTTVRHHELYKDAQIRRELMDEKRKNEETSRARQVQERMVHKTDERPVDTQYLDKLYVEHERRVRRHAAKLVEKERSENAMLQKMCGGDGSARSRSTSSRRRAASPGGKPGTSLVLSMTLDGINGTLLSECVRDGLLHKFKSAIIQAITDDASHVCLPDHVEVKSLNFASDCCHIEVTIQFPSKSSTTAMQMRLGSSTTLRERIAKSVTGLDGISDMVTGSVAVTDVNIMPVVQKPPEPYVPQSKPRPAHENCASKTFPAQTDKRARSRSASQSHTEPITQADVAFNSILEAIQIRSGAKLHAITSLEPKEFVPLLQAAVNVYNEAHTDRVGNDGYKTLCEMASARLCSAAKLLPEFQVFNTFSEPVPIRQVQESLDELMASAERAQLFLQGRLFADGRADSWPVGEIHVKPPNIPAALFAYNPGPKSRAAAEVKSWVTYAPAEGAKRHRNLLDLARISLVFATPQMVQAGLDMVLANFEVIAIRNFFSTPGRLGARYIDVSVIIYVQAESEDDMAFHAATIPHICELRLEDMTFYKAQKCAKKHLDQFFTCLGARMEHFRLDRNAMVYLARQVLFSSPTSHNLRVFRRQLAWRYGSVTGAWRKALGNERLLPFVKLRDTAQALRLGENVVKYWAELAPGLGGTCSLFELDPDNTSLLALFLSRVLAMCHDDSSPEDLFARLSFRIMPERAGHLHVSEFRNVAKPLGFSVGECERIFQSLDSGSGSPASITVSDLAWLARLPSIVELRHINLNSVSGPDDSDSFRSVYWPPIYGVKLPPEVLEPKSTEPMTARGNARDASPIKSALKKGSLKQTPDVSFGETPPRPVDMFATPTSKGFFSPPAGSAGEETKSGSQYQSQDSQWQPSTFSPGARVGRSPSDWRPDDSRDLGAEDTELAHERSQREELEKELEDMKNERQALKQVVTAQLRVNEALRDVTGQTPVAQRRRTSLQKEFEDLKGEYAVIREHEALKTEHRQDLKEKENLRQQLKLVEAAQASQDAEIRELREANKRMSQEASQATCQAKLEAEETLRRTSTAELAMETRYKDEQEVLRAEQDMLRAEVRRSLQLTEAQRKALMADAEELRRLARAELEEEEQAHRENGATEAHEMARLQRERDELLAKNEAMQKAADQHRNLEMQLQLDTKLLDELASEREALILQNSSLKTECHEYEDRVKCHTVLIDGGAAELRQKNCQIESDNEQFKEMTEAYHEHESSIVLKLLEENAELRARSGSIHDLHATEPHSQEDTPTTGRRFTAEELSCAVKIQAAERGRRGRAEAQGRKEEYENESF